VINDIVHAEFVHRIQLNDCVRDYVLNAANLRDPQVAGMAQGRLGAMVHGIHPESLWGFSTRTIKVNYFLDFAKYPKLQESMAALDAARARLEPFQ
jgi:hypothetical protein